MDKRACCDIHVAAPWVVLTDKNVIKSYYGLAKYTGKEVYHRYPESGGIHPAQTGACQAGLPILTCSFQAPFSLWLSSP